MPDNGEHKSIGGYRIIREIGRGGMATVYEAENKDGRIFALKVLDVARSRKERSVGRFLREGEAARRLSHPNIIKIHDVGQEGEYCYIAMDLIDGPTLEDMIFELRRKRKDALSHFRPDFAFLPDPVIGQEAYQRSIVEAMAGVMMAVEQAHSVGLVHRDIKPSNILIADNGKLILTDFGLVQDLGAETLTITGDVLGTPLYMSPEQIAGKKDAIGPKADIYALGATLHELLGLSSPFSATDLALLARQIATQEPRDLAELNPNIPKSLHTIVRRAMAKRPSDRYARASEIAADINHFLAGRKIFAKPPTTTEKIRAFVRRNPGRAVAMVAIVIVLISAQVVAVVVEKNANARKLRDADQTFAEGEAFVARGAWVAAWQAVEELEAELPAGERAAKLRTKVEEGLEKSFRKLCGEGASGLRAAFNLRQIVLRFKDSKINTEAWRQMLVAGFVEEATKKSGGVDESSLDWLWGRLKAESTEDGRRRLTIHLARRSAAAVARFDFRSAYEIAGRAERWGLAAKSFPPLDFKDWDSTPYRQLDRLANDLLNRPMESVVQELDRESVLALPWPESRSLFQRSLATAKENDVLAFIRVIQDAKIPGLANDLFAAGQRMPTIRPDLLAFWSVQPDSQAQDGLVTWAQDLKSQRDLILLARALKNPNAKAQEFLLSQLATADVPLVEVIAETLPSVKDPKDLAAWKRRLEQMDEDERLPFVRAFVSMGGDAPWSWVEASLDAEMPALEKLVQATSERPGLVPQTWAQSYVDDANPFRRRIARTALIANKATRKSWSEKILLDRAEDSAFRIRAGLSLEQVELRELLKSVVPDIAGDPILSGFALSLDGSVFERGTDEFTKRVALLFEVYKEGGDNLIRAWALAGLESLNVPEFATFIARDLASFEAEANSSLLRDIFGQSMQNQELSLVLTELAKHGRHRALARTPTVNSARCRLLAKMGELPTWPKGVSRGDVARTLIECAARRDLEPSTREAALEALKAFPDAAELKELEAATVYDPDGRLAAQAALVLSAQGKDQQAFRLLEARKRSASPIFVARAWLYARANRPDEAVAFLELAYMKGYRLNGGEPDFESLDNLGNRPDFAEIWRRLGSS